MQRFYSKLVRLKVAGEGSIGATYNRFYSKLVRLKVQEFSTGRLSAEFLFQIGAIKSSLPVLVAQSDLSFYSKLVRLKVVLTLSLRYFHHTFLFQIGAIKRGAA